MTFRRNNIYYSEKRQDTNVLVKDQPAWCGSKAAKLQFSLGCKPLFSPLFFLIKRERNTMSQTYIYKEKRHYGFFNFLFDVFMTVLTCGFWLIWIFVRESRNR